MQRVRLSGVRTRILAIAFVPSLALFGIGVGYTIYLEDEASHAEDFSRSMAGSLSFTKELMASVEDERLLSIAQLSGQDADAKALTAARARVDKALGGLGSTGRSMQRVGGADMDQKVAAFNKLVTVQLPGLRTGVDAGAVQIPDVYAFYTALLDGVDKGSKIVGQNAPTISAAIDEMISLKLFQAVEANSRANALTSPVAGSDLPPALMSEYRNNVGLYHSLLNQLSNDLDDADAKLVKDLLASPALAQVTTMEDALLHPAPPKNGAPAPLPMTIEEWRTAANSVSEQLFNVTIQQNAAGMTSAADLAHSRSRAVLVSGGSAIALAIVAFAIAVLLANRIIARLRRLRSETLALAEVQLPETMRKIDAGEQVDPAAEAAHLDFGNDEIGEVAQAFNRAHTAAVSAAITEARTREGVRSVFLNIAHRSQIVVARQLELLDQAESKQEDPALLDTFFRLDHLATRERRNAENLIILGGGKPGRQWRRPVPLMELVRSAVAETLDYARVNTHRLPRVFVLGNVVADLMHLLAELVDNATAFSPPQSRVDVTGNSVGKGVVVEVSDQGMGMPADELERVNEMLRNPPDFGLATLSADSRLGLFVVAQLATRHGISVRLTDSDYGGIRAIVLIPVGLITTDAPVADHLRDRVPVRQAPAPAAVTGSYPMQSLESGPAAPAYAPEPTSYTPEPTSYAPEPTYAPEPAYAPEPDPVDSFAAQDDAEFGFDRSVFDTGRHHVAPADPPYQPPPPERPTYERQSYQEPADTSYLRPAAPPETSYGRPVDQPDTAYLRAIPQPEPEQRPSARPTPSAPSAGGGGTRPPLPRRRKQASLAPELADDPQAEEYGSEPARSADQARDLMSAIENGTRQGRRARPEPYPTSANPVASNEQEGEGDFFYRR
ncbi:sensor histidine kinase [Nocardia sp. BMG111209]|uniref:sensor histidine kinase n=1 Tax=Nocardia sp. BMG111209 TaxID=1160137 RepID=UPI000379A9C2|nr:sensor histidine kinase [Nocardia sp. BMG111209]